MRSGLGETPVDPGHSMQDDTEQRSPKELYSRLGEDQDERVTFAKMYTDTIMAAS